MFAVAGGEREPHSPTASNSLAAERLPSASAPRKLSKRTKAAPHIVLPADTAAEVPLGPHVNSRAASMPNGSSPTRVTELPRRGIIHMDTNGITHNQPVAGALDEEAPLIPNSLLTRYDGSTAATNRKLPTRVWQLPWHSLALFAGICCVALFNGMMVAAFEPTQLLYLQSIGLASDTDVSFFILLTALAYTSPIVGTFLLSWLSTRIGAPRALVVSALTVAVGMLTVIVARTRPAFIFGFLAYGLTSSNRTLRQIFVTENVPRSCRTQAMSIHAFMSPLGALFGPLIWLLCTRYRGEFNLPFGIVFNKFTLTYFILVGLNMAMVGLATFLHLGKRNLDLHRNSSGENMQQLNEEDRPLTSNHSKMMTVLFFCALSLLTSLSMSIWLNTFQPIMVNYMGVNGAHLGAVYEGTKLFELVPPVIVSFMTGFLHDRTIMMIGLALKLVGAALYLPLFGRVYEVQVIIGYALEGKASLFFETAMLSLFSAKFDSSTNGMGIGFVASTFSFGYVISMYTMGVPAVQMFGTFKFAVFAIPVAIALLMLVANWKRLR